MTTRGGAGDVLSETGDRRGVVGALTPPSAPREARLGAEALAVEGDDGPGAEDGTGVLDAGGPGDLDF